ncbi:MAG: 4-hydroxy-tetrahydrodipicolinate reductase [Pirellulaceae bacterium]|nr:4-hydroxy-tetrahydrodipicolinate reductase [Planctomycetales bacterium]
MVTTRVVIHGAAGRMGRRLLAIGSADPELQIVGAMEHAGHPAIGQDAGTLAGVAPLRIPVQDHLPDNVDVVVDFSAPDATDSIVSLCLERRLPLVMATTGLEPHSQQALRAASSSIPIVWAPSMSLAVNLTMKLAQAAAEALHTYPGGADVEIIETHHRFKEDAPSGTALKFGELIAQAMHLSGQAHGRHGRPGARPHDEIGYHAVRAGDNPGEHHIIFGMLGESIELTVRASNRDCYVHGALQAAKFLRQRTAGLYSMFDVLGM